MSFDFTPTVDALESVPDPYRALYSEQEGKFVLDAEIAKRLDVSGLKTQLSKANKEAMERRKALEAYAALEKTPEELQELLSKFDDQQSKDSEKKGEWDKLKAQIEGKHAKEVEALAGSVANLRKELERTMLDGEALRAIAEEKGVPELLMPTIRNRTKMVEENGKLRIQVLDVDGETTLLNRSNEPASIKDLVSALRDDKIYSRAFDASGTNGSGANPGNSAAPGGSHGNKQRSKMTDVEKAKFTAQYGPEAFANLPA